MPRLGVALVTCHRTSSSAGNEQQAVVVIPEVPTQLERDGCRHADRARVLALRRGVLHGAPDAPHLPIDRDKAIFDVDAIDGEAEHFTDTKTHGTERDRCTEPRAHRLRLPSDIALLLKTVMMCEGVAAQLDPKFELIPMLVPYATTLIARDTNNAT
jgi:hypothetical protein